MYVLIFKNEHIVWTEWWYIFMSRISLQANFYMTQEDQIFIADAVVTNSTWEIVSSSVINQPTCATTEFNAIVKICKYRGFYEGHHFYYDGHENA
jgi:hypothetical protein